MNKWSVHWRGMPRKKRVLILLAVLAALVPLIYLLSGCPPLTPEMAMHRAEKAQMVGPSTVIAAEEVHIYGMNCVLVGQTEYGFTLYGYNSSTDASDQVLIYREKAGPLTLLALTNPPAMNRDFGEALPIFLFAEYPKAVRAELQILYEDPYDGKNRFLYDLVSENNSGYFRFDLPFNQEQFSLTDSGNFSIHMSGDAYRENEAIHAIGRTLAGKWGDVSIPVTVRLYDRDGGLITEQSLLIQSWDEY